MATIVAINVVGSLSRSASGALGVKQYQIPIQIYSTNPNTIVGHKWIPSKLACTVRECSVAASMHRELLQRCYDVSSARQVYEDRAEGGS